MKKYRIEHWAWVAGSGYSYNEIIDNIDEIVTAEELGEAYGDYCTEGDEIREYDNESDEEIARYTAK